MLAYQLDETPHFQKLISAGYDLFKIHADYRPLNSQKTTNYYYVFASSKKQARERFTRRITWLKIYSVNKCDVEEREQIFRQHTEEGKHIIF